MFQTRKISGFFQQLIIFTDLFDVHNLIVCLSFVWFHDNYEHMLRHIWTLIYIKVKRTYIISFMDEFNPFGAQLDILMAEFCRLLIWGSEANISWCFCLFYITQVVI